MVTNAISTIVLVGAILVAITHAFLDETITTLAVALASVNALFYMIKPMMMLGDAKEVVEDGTKAVS